MKKILDKKNIERYSRQIVLKDVGVIGQKAICNSKVLIVGAGGLGYYIPTYLKYYQYDKVMALLIILFFVVVIIDLFSMKARSYFVDDATFKSPSLFGNIFRAKKWTINR